MTQLENKQPDFSRPARETVSLDTIASLSFDFLKQLSTLSLASAGGVITLLETSLTAPKARLFGYLAGGVVCLGKRANRKLLFLAAILALQAQQILVERLRSGSLDYNDAKFSRVKLGRSGKTEQRITMTSFLMFGIGVGLLIGSLLSN
jgi:hypothetical protein